VEDPQPVILSEAKDLELLLESTFTNKCRSFAALKMTAFQLAQYHLQPKKHTTSE